MPAVKRTSPITLYIPSLDELQPHVRRLALQRKLTELQNTLTGLESTIAIYNQKRKASLDERLLSGLGLSSEAKTIARKRRYATKIQQAISNINQEVYRIYSSSNIDPWTEKIDPQLTSAEGILESIQKSIYLSQTTPIKLNPRIWIFKDYFYIVEGPYIDEQFKLLIFESFDRERIRFERLKQKFDSSSQVEKQPRHRIPEKVRIEIWQRDGGKCAKCGSREKLEYDHIVPLSKGGSNTARNIELLCEKCNRTKSANPA
jgi:hypothetical protein